MKLKCINCGSTDMRARISTKERLCRKCGNIWNYEIKKPEPKKIEDTIDMDKLADSIMKEAEEKFILLEIFEGDKEIYTERLVRLAILKTIENIENHY